MAQFDVYKNPNPATRKTFPYLLDIQNNLFDKLATRIVAPLASEKAITPMTRLNPAFEVEGKRVYMSTAEMAGVSKNALGKYVGSLAFQRQQILDALDFIVTGF